MDKLKKKFVKEINFDKIVEGDLVYIERNNNWWFILIDKRTNKMSNFYKDFISGNILKCGANNNFFQIGGRGVFMDESYYKFYIQENKGDKR